MRNRDRLIGIWEQLKNPGFNSSEFEGIKSVLARSSGL